MSWGSPGLITVCFPSPLHSLKGLGLGRDHNRSSPHAGQIPRAQFRGRAGLGVGGKRRGGCRTRFRGLRDCLIVARWRLSEGGSFAVVLESCHCRNTSSLASVCHVVYHGLGGGGAWARAARARWGQGIGLHQFGFGSLCILPEMISKSPLNRSY